MGAEVERDGQGVSAAGFLASAGMPAVVALHAHRLGDAEVRAPLIKSSLGHDPVVGAPEAVVSARDAVGTLGVEVPPAYNSFLLERPAVGSTIHKVYVEEIGNPAGIPVVIVHGGPGYVFPRNDLGFLDPENFRIILIDQRGIGRSLPLGAIEGNTTEHLVGDMEAVREALGIDKWHVFGWSWGAMLGAVYTERHPSSVRSFVGYGAAKGTYEEDAFFLSRLGEDHPTVLASILAVSPPDRFPNYADGFYERLDGPQHNDMLRLWYELAPDAPITPGYDARFRVNLEYFHNHFFLGPNQIVADAPRAGDVPVLILHGERDRYIPKESAVEIAAAFPRGEFGLLDASHSVAEPVVQRFLQAHYRGISSSSALQS